jgi:hypothetical protein
MATTHRPAWQIDGAQREVEDRLWGHFGKSCVILAWRADTGVMFHEYMDRLAPVVVLKAGARVGATRE